MIRAAVRFLLVCGLLLLISPFLISSFLIDQQGIGISGTVHSKDERVSVHYSSWTRSSEVTIEYMPPEEPGVAFLKAQLEPNRFDDLKLGDSVKLRYLRRQDLPHIPGATVLRQLHVLPAARLADQRAWSGLLRTVSGIPTAVLVAIAAVICILALWRLARLPLFGWAVAASILCAIPVELVHEFPVPAPPPEHEVRSTSGTVKSIERVEWLFRDNHQQGFEAAQPIQIVGVSFLPEERTEPVLAVDLIDAGSVSGLKEHARVDMDYESGSPRTAYIRGARRQFVRKNLKGITTEIIAALVAIVLLLVGASLIGRGYRRLTQRVRA